MFFLQFVVGAVLVALGVAFWLARNNADVASALEKLFNIDQGQLFVKGLAHSVYVTWCKNVSFFAGAAMLVPTRMLVDVIIGMIAAGIFWWMSRQKTIHDRAVGGKRQSVS